MTHLEDRRSAQHKPALPVTSHYTAKDQRKWDRCNKMIGQGSPRSSTHRYAQALGRLANSGRYQAGDVVFISAEGARGGRLSPDWTEINRAILAGVQFVTDTQIDRLRSYNLGEREVAGYLQKQGYRDDNSGLWTKTQESKA